ncbi:sugar porter family MFS transporter [Paraburkholderia agricolaris]|jgi:sugar porter (SP) family MFS transporter|uniref:Sugar porter family MFS transporter n=1 Tax=Paraburkholderia agricolaris TaxID=2152888 RepID=A0ABW8ZVS5_9BURK
MRTDAIKLPEQRSEGRSQAIYVFGALGGILHGYDMGIIAGAMFFIKSDMGLSPQGVGMVVGSLLAGAILGTFCTGRLAEAIGQRWMLIWAGVLFFATSLFAALAWDATSLIVARVLMGAAVGVSVTQVPSYLAEISPKSKRGALTSLNQLATSTGIFAAYLAGYLLAPIEGWRWMLGLAAIPSAMLTVGLLFQPDSPRWLVRRGHRKEALEALQINHSPDDAQKVLAEIEHAHRNEILKKSEIRLVDLLKTKSVRPVVITVMCLGALQPATGINAIVYYVPTILNEAGFSQSLALLNSVVLAVMSIVMTIYASRVVDRIGRRPLMIGGACVMGTSMAVLGMMAYMPKTAISGYIALGALAAFKAAFSFSWGPIGWVLVTEILPSNIRSQGLALTGTVNFLTNMVIVSTFPVLLHVNVALVFGVFTCTGLLAATFVGLRIRETTGRSLEAIEHDL